MNPDIVIPQPGRDGWTRSLDLDDMSAWVEYLAADVGIVFATKAMGRVRQLMLDQRSCDPYSIAYFEPTSLWGAQYLARHNL